MTNEMTGRRNDVSIHVEFSPWGQLCSCGFGGSEKGLEGGTVHTAC